MRGGSPRRCQRSRRDEYLTPLSFVQDSLLGLCVPVASDYFRGGGCAAGVFHFDELPVVSYDLFAACPLSAIRRSGWHSWLLFVHFVLCCRRRTRSLERTAAPLFRSTIYCCLGGFTVSDRFSRRLSLSYAVRWTHARELEAGIRIIVIGPHELQDLHWSPDRSDRHHSPQAVAFTHPRKGRAACHEPDFPIRFLAVSEPYHRTMPRSQQPLRFFELFEHQLHYVGLLLDLSFCRLATCSRMRAAHKSNISSGVVSRNLESIPSANVLGQMPSSSFAASLIQFTHTCIGIERSNVTRGSSAESPRGAPVVRESVCIRILSGFSAGSLPRSVSPPTGIPSFNQFCFLVRVAESSWLN